MGGIFDNTFANGAYRLALGLVIVADAFGAFVGVNHIDVGPTTNGFVRAVGFAHIAVNALGID